MVEIGRVAQNIRNLVRFLKDTNKHLYIRFETEEEYIDYLAEKDIIDPYFSDILHKLVGHTPENVIIDEVSLNNTLFIGDPRGADRPGGFKDAFELLMEATMIWEFSAIDAMEKTMQVIRTLLRDKEHRYQEKLIRIT